MLLTIVTSTSFAKALDSTLNYAPVKIAAHTEVTFNLEKASPAGMQENVDYTMVCTTSANADTVMALAMFPAPSCARWSGTKVNGNDVGYQFKLPANGKIEFDNLIGIFKLNISH